MAAQKKYPDELRERAVRMLFEVREREGKGHGELARVARQLGVHPEALRSWQSRRKSTADRGPGPRPMISSGSRSWRRKTGSSAGLMRS
jgi:transposase